MPRPGEGAHRSHLASLPKDVDLPTESSIEQRHVLRTVSEVFHSMETTIEGCDEKFPLQRAETIAYLCQGLGDLPSGFASLDASRPWICYWILNALDILDAVHKLDTETLDSIVDLLSRCQSPTGGFGGGPSQLAHLASTYAAVNALTIIGTPAARAVVNRTTLQQFLCEMHQPNGSFTMHNEGEVDVRGSYCALAAAKLSGVLVDELKVNTAAFIKSCQSYEGGIGATPGNEAHGGYTFCALAALALIDRDAALSIDISRLSRWVVDRQMSFEGGFQGRTNKLVDGCYSFWQGGVFPILSTLAGDSFRPPLCDEKALQRYILLACQCSGGGLRDKPGKSRDHYHTCYCLAGLSASQHRSTKWTTVGVEGFSHVTPPTDTEKFAPLYGDPSNLLKEIHPVYCLTMERVRAVFGESSTSM